MFPVAALRGSVSDVPAVLHDVDRAVLQFFEEHRDVLADDPDDDEENGEHEAEQHDDRRVAGRRAVTGHQGIDQHDHPQKSAEEAGEDAELEWHVREAHDGVHREDEELSNRIVAAARHTRGCLIGNRGLPEADVLHVTAEETDLLPVVFREHLLYRAGDGKEVRGIGLQVDLRHAVDEPVEAAGGDVFQKPGRFVFGADHGDYLEAGIELVDDVSEVLRRML